MREIRLSGSEGGEGFNPLSLPLSLVKTTVFQFIGGAGSGSPAQRRGVPTATREAIMRIPAVWRNRVAPRLLRRL